MPQCPCSCFDSHWSSNMGLSSSQNPLIRPTVGPDVGVLTTMELIQGLGEIVAADTNNIMVQVATPTD